jgi:glycerol-3-phosphate dehydrogenase (NAD(P)+)
MSRVAVMGAGSWGTAFAQVLADAGSDVVVWGRDEKVVHAITHHHENPRFHPGVTLPPTVWATIDEREALHGADVVVLAIPAQVLRGALERWAPDLADAVLVSLIKGLELGTSLRMSEVVVDVTGLPAERLCVVSGPNLAREIVLRQPAAAVVAGVDESVAAQVQRACLAPYFRPYTNTDVIGVELGGAVKNVIALAVGMVVGMGFGDNARAGLITRGLAETVRLGVALGADPLTFSGLAGVGDLVATCMSPLSRNRSFGELLGQGLSVEQAAAATSQTAEGVASSKALLELARRSGIDMPVTEAVEAVVHEGANPRDMVGTLMARGTKSELTP